MEKILDPLYRGFRFLLESVIGNIAALTMLAATLLAIIEVFRRYVFGQGFHWGQDAVTYGMVASLFIYFGVAQVRRSHLAVSAGVDELRRRGYLKTVLTIRAMISALSMTLCGSMAWWGIPTVERSLALERATQSMVLKLWPFQLALIIGFTLMAIASLLHLYQDIQAVRGKEVFAWAPVEEGLDI